ncbi:hypothetical protein DVH24_026440 [Malus domestica]|uniref:Uncharacterized protein n=1 Tax=Malus domestica TaxID=3750 RepID=A0A498KLK2_MALDO|nr:hypothetical protein DVH24_026440 [Malus domestica]
MLIENQEDENHGLSGHQTNLTRSPTPLISVTLATSKDLGSRSSSSSLVAPLPDATRPSTILSSTKGLLESDMNRKNGLWIGLE